MESYEVLIIIAVALVFGISVYLLVHTTIVHRRISAVHELFSSTLPGVQITPAKVSFFDFHLERGDTTYLLKVIPFDSNHELIITNQYFWCVNSDLKGWKRSTVPDLVSGVKEFIDYKPETSNKIVKIAMIFPTCYNITRYLNESDVAIVKPRDLVYGVYFVKAADLQIFFHKPE